MQYADRLCSGCAEGVLFAEKDFNLKEHPEIPGVSNLQVIKLMQSFTSKELVTERFAWRHYYWCASYPASVAAVLNCTACTVCAPVSLPVYCMAMRTASMRGAPAPVGLVFWDSNGNLSHCKFLRRHASLSMPIMIVAVTTLSTWGSPALATQSSGIAVEI